VHRLLGLAVWTAGDQNRAIQELRLAIERRPDDERARLQLALVLRASDRPSEAESELRAAIERLPQSGQARYQLGQLLESQSRLREAASAYAETTAHPPVVGRDYLYQRLARVRVNQADFEGAIAAYAARVAVNPNSGEAHRSLGEIYFLQGRDDEAVAELLVAVWLDPRDSRALAALGKAFVRGERYADAVPVLRRVVAIDAARADAHYALGQALLRLRQPDEGRREIEEFQRLEAAERERGQRDFRIEQWRGDAARSMSTGDLAGALAVLQRIRQEDPENPRWVREVGITLLRARRFDDSVAALEAAQARQPTLDGARLLADAYAAAGRPAESRQHLAQYQQALEAARLDQLLTMNLGS
jgi:tetratricopeptide (TPR) repeat protein